MSAEQILFIIFAVFAVLGAADRIIGNRFGVGKAFERGIMTMGPLALSMIGMIVLAPVLANWLRPVITPVYQWLGADPAIFAGSLLACDMGGAPLAEALTDDPAAAARGGYIVSSLLGVTVTFTIPVAMGVLSKKDRPFAAKGILCGVLTVPVGVLVGGLAAGFPILMILKNLIPILPLSLLIALGLWKAERFLIRAFTVFGWCMTALATVGLLLASLSFLLDRTILPDMAPLDEALITVGRIAIVLSGAFPLMHLLTLCLKKPLRYLGKHLGMNEISVSGLLATSVNSIATFDTVKEMDVRGKVVNMAFAVSAAFVFGDHLAYTAGNAPKMLLPLIAAKLTAGVTALLLALWLTSTKEKRNEENSHV
ncbi:MAG: ethanolamine utilization protein EutH [Clostridia bacterium]|nr:ethanolamine utilization protein EutH [Clostridia bacterium]